MAISLNTTNQTIRLSICKIFEIGCGSPCWICFDQVISIPWVMSAFIMGYYDVKEVGQAIRQSFQGANTYIRRTVSTSFLSSGNVFLPWTTNIENLSWILKYIFIICGHVLFHNDVPKYLNQIYSLLLLFIEYSQVNSFLQIFLFFQMYIADFK